MRRSLHRLIAAGLSGAALVGLPAAASADTAPTIEGVAVSHITATDATLQATINPQGAEHGVYYQFQLLVGASEYLPEFECPTEGFPAHSSLCLGLPSEPGALPIGFIHGSSQSESVQLDLLAAGRKLDPGTTYSFRVIAARAIQTEDTIAWEEPIVDWPQQTFATPPAGAVPVIDSVAVSHLTPTDATLEAQIDTQGLSTSYEFGMVSSPCERHHEACLVMITYPLPSGLLLGSFVDQRVSLDLNSAGVTLAQGEAYDWSVDATNAAGSASAGGPAFEPPSGIVDPPPPVPEPTGGGTQPTTTLGGGQSVETHPSGSPSPPPSPSSGAGSASPLGASAHSDASMHSAHKAKRHRHHHHRHKPA